MKFLKAQPLHNEPVLFIKDKKTIVVADLHIGIESQLREQGLNVSSQTENMSKHLFSLCKRLKPKEIILLGDIKHNIPSSTIQERRDVKIFLQEIQRYGIVHIVPGNHDGNIDKLCPEEVIIHPSSGFIFDDIGFIHGHRWPNQEVMSSKQIIMGHTHPTIMFTDRLGYKSFESCWIKTSFLENNLKKRYPSVSVGSQLLIMPAFNPLCGGNPVNVGGIVGPLGNIIDLENSDVYLLDGILIGKIKNLR